MFVGHDLEHQTAERRARVRRAHLFLTIFRIDSLDRRNIKRRRQVINDRIQQRLYSLFLNAEPVTTGHEAQR